MASYFDNVAQDGFLIDAGRMLYISSSPAAIPSGADALITLSSTKQEELSGCLPNNKQPKMKYFDYYDTLGLLSYLEHGTLHEAIDIGGCWVPILTFFPK